MPVEINKELIKSLFEDVLNRGNPDKIYELISTDYHEQDLMTGQSQGLNGVRQRLEIIFEAFPDARYTIEDIISDEEKVAVRWIMTGTHLGNFMNIAPTGRLISMKGIDIYEISDQLIVTHWNEVDVYGLLNQLKT